MKNDERKPLSKAIVLQELQREYKGLFIMDLAISFGLAGIGLIAVAIISLFWHISVAVKIIGLLFCLPFWGCAVYFLLRGLCKRLRNWRDLDSDCLRIEIDEVSSKSTEIRQSRNGNPITFHLVDLSRHGSHSISEAVWTVTSEGDSVYVAVLIWEKPTVVGVYPALTHKLIEP